VSGPPSITRRKDPEASVAPPRRRYILHVLLLAPPLLTLGLFAACTGSSKPKIILAVQPSASITEVSASAKPIEAFLEERMDVDIEIYVPTTYAAVVEALRFGNADAGFMSAWPSLLATRLADAELVLAEVREVIIGQEKEEEPFYFSYWVVPQDSPYTNLAELKDKAACFPSPLSTSGFVFPMAKLVGLGFLPQPPEGEEADPEDFFADVVFAGGYSQCWEALRSGQVDVAVIAGDVPEELYNDVLANTNVLEEQGPIPSHGVVFNNDLQEPLRGQLKAALLELGENRELMRKFISGIFVRFEETTAEEHLSALESSIQTTGLSFSERLPEEIQ